RISRPCLGDEEIEAVAEVLRSGILAQSDRVREFEREFARYVGARHGVAVVNGTAALVVALQAMGVGPGDEVVTTPLTFFGTVAAILAVGATPVFADVDPETFNLDPGKLEEVMGDRVRAVIPVHLFGHPADMDPIMKIAEEADALVLEDAAQAHGAEYRGRRVGSIGHAAAFSFYPTKNMTTGEGGMITTDDGKIAGRARAFRDQGQTAKYRHEYLGLNLRMNEISAAIGLIQLRKLDSFNERRREIARTYTEALEGMDGVEPPVEKPWARHAWHLYPVRAVGVDRDRLVRSLNEAGVQARPTYPCPAYRQPIMERLGEREYDPLWAIRDRRYRGAPCPVAERLVKELFYLPIHPCLTDGDLDYVIRALRDALREAG
ncbi:MAG: aminotransferase DegT, partial [Thermoproteota archaeon]